MDSNEYELFRTYSLPAPQVFGSVAAPSSISKDSRTSAACAATAAAKHILKPYRHGKRTYFDTIFPMPHDISTLAIVEASHLCAGRDISFMANIGPGIPTQADLDVLEESEKILSDGKFKGKLAAAIQSAIPWRLTRSYATPDSALNTAREPRNRATQVSSQRAAEEARRLAAATEERLKLNLRSGDEPTQVFHILKPEFAPQYTSLNDINYIDTLMKKFDNFLKEKQGSIIAAANHFGPIEIPDTPPAGTSLTHLKAGQGNAEPGTAAAFRQSISIFTSASQVQELSRERHGTERNGQPDGESTPKSYKYS